MFPVTNISLADLSIMFPLQCSWCTSDNPFGQLTDIHFDEVRSLLAFLKTSEKLKMISLPLSLI